MLVEEGLVRPDQVHEALAKKAETGQFIGQILVELGYVSEQDLVAVLVKQCKIPHLNLLDYEIKKDVLDLVPYETCRERRVLPVDKLGSILTVAMVDPFDTEILEKLRKDTGLRVKPVLSNWYDFELVFARLFGSGRAEAARPAEQRQEASERQTKSAVAEPVEKEGAERAEAGPEPVGEVSEPPSDAAQVKEKEGVALEVGERQEEEEEGEEEEEKGASSGAAVAGKKEASVRIEVLEVGVEEAEGEVELEVGVPVEGDRAVARMAREPRAVESKDTDDDLPLGEYTFENFLVGQVNTFTYAIARAVADAPGSEYNPLFIYGDVGLGKTHLICAVGNEVMVTHPEKRVLYTSAGTFGTHLVEAIQRHDLVSFRERYTERDVVMVDDAQFLAGREKTQEEFFDIFNALHEAHKQIIIASDKPPSALVALEKRLVSRFAGGIVAGLAAPEWETRMAILKYQVEKAGCEVPEDVMALVATRVTDDVRKLLGAMRKVMAFCELVQQDISTDLAQEVLDHLFEKKQRGNR